MVRLVVVGTLSTAEPEVCCSFGKFRFGGVNITPRDYKVAWECTACGVIQWKGNQGYLHVQSSDDLERTKNRNYFPTGYLEVTTCNEREIPSTSD